MTKNQRQTPAPVAPYANNLTVSETLTFDVKISSPKSGFKALNYLLSKEKYGREWSQMDEVLYFYLLDYFQAYQGNRRIHRLNQDVRNCTLLRLVELRQHCKYLENVPSWVTAQKAILEKKLFSPRALLGLGKNFVKSFFRKKNRLLNRVPPPARYIGVGYRDQGATSDPSYDASPSWQKVGSCSLPGIKYEESRIEYLLLNFTRFKRQLSS